ncbi:hypothetical protein CORC01_04448 [Colletotrichum orchidophilum]|uniref:Uncharacterized protein n=1 Tax=Colletotrichum orchidophilum TaxID=1209926 RepID=A0A1G4BFU8_9PEZI|nr:uncharacterized protein CORC01_04448 [Colletotrichum orchidophilum]OHF00259.1 hypothetical protein CORC01_04448 [Colletotrichum orchidophilum]
MSLTTSLKRTNPATLEIKQVEASSYEQLLGLIANCCLPIYPDPGIKDLASEEVDAVAKPMHSDYSPKDLNCQVQQHERMLIYARKIEPHECSVLSHRHARLHAGRQFDGEVTSLGDGLVQVMLRRPVPDPEHTVLELIAGTDLREERKFTQAGDSPGAAIMDNAEAGDVASIGREFAGSVSVDVTRGLGEAVRCCCVGENVSAALGADQGVCEG